MARIGFYHLLRMPLEQALPRLLAKALEGGHKVMVLAGGPERVEDLNSRLWTFDPASWLPHGSGKDGDAALQPIWLTDQDEAPPNGASVLVLCDGADSDRLGAYQRCLDLFDGNDEEAVAAARIRWKIRKDTGHELVYYQQNDKGGWDEKARNAPESPP